MTDFFFSDSAEIWVLSARNVSNTTTIQFSPPRVMFKHKGKLAEKKKPMATTDLALTRWRLFMIIEP